MIGKLFWRFEVKFVGTGHYRDKAFIVEGYNVGRTRVGQTTIEHLVLVAYQEGPPRARANDFRMDWGNLLCSRASGSENKMTAAEATDTAKADHGGYRHPLVSVRP